MSDYRSGAIIRTSRPLDQELLRDYTCPGMSTRKTVTKAAGIMTAAILLSRVLGLVRESVIAGVFGQNRPTDIYNAAFALPDVLFFLIAGGALSSAFIPVFTELFKAGKEREAWKTFSVIATVMGLVVGAFILVTEIFARQLVPVLSAPGFSHSELDRVAALTRIVLPSQFFFFIGGLMMGTLYSRGHFVSPGLGPSIYNIGIMSGALILGHRLGIAGLCWGALCGAFAGNFLLQLITMSRLGASYRPSLDFRDPGAIKVWKLMVPVIFGLSLPQIDVWINRWLATFLSAGIATALVRGNQLMQVPVGVFGQSTAIAFFPTLSDQAAQGEQDEFKNTLNYGLRLILFAAIPSSVLLGVLAKPIVILLFQHGRFSQADTTVVSLTLMFYSIGIAGWCMQAMVARAFYAMQDTFTPVWTGTLMTLIFIPAKWAVVHYGGDALYWGMALGTSLSATTHVLLLLFIARKRLHGIHGKLLLSSASKVAAASAALGVVAYLVSFNISTIPALSIAGGKGQALGIVVLSSLLGGLAFLAVVKLLKVEEASAAWGMMKERFSRGGREAA